MKKHLFILPFLCLGMSVSGQFVLEHTYANAGTPTSFNQFSMVELEDLGQLYMFFDRTARTLQFFDLDHQLVQTIDLTGVPDVAPGNPGGKFVLYVSQYLFDLDPGIELMYFSGGGPAPTMVMTVIVDESGAAIQSFPNEAPYVTVTVPQGDKPIYETPDGAKMVLSHQVTNEAKVYGLPGHLTTGMVEQGGDVSVAGTVKVFPNPAISGFVVSIDPGSVSGAQVLRLYAEDGRLALEKDIDGATTEVRGSALGQGSYTYTIWRNGRPWYAGKVIVQ